MKRLHWVLAFSAGLAAVGCRHGQPYVPADAPPPNATQTAFQEDNGDNVDQAPATDGPISVPVIAELPILPPITPAPSPPPPKKQKPPIVPLPAKSIPRPADPEWIGTLPGSTAKSPSTATAVPPMPELPTVPARQPGDLAGGLRTLTGRVQSWRQGWMLRYADCGVADVCGGSAILEGNQLDNLRDGCKVRVEGVMIPPADRAASARFQVKVLQIVD